MAIGLGGITGFAALQVARLLRGRHVKIQDLTLHPGTAAGRVFVIAMVAWLAFTAHSAFVQWHRARGAVWLERTEASRAEVMSGEFRTKSYSQAHRRAVEETFRHFSLADRFGLLGVVDVKLGLAWAHLLRDEPGDAEREMRAAVALAPEHAALWEDLYELLLARGLHGDAADALGRKMELGMATDEERFLRGSLLADAGRLEEAASAFATIVAADPGSSIARYDLGGVLRRLGRFDEAIEQLSAAMRLAPDDADAAVELGLAFRAARRNDEAIRAFRRAIELRPDAPESRLHLPKLIRELEAETR
jgi:tetratricopeptide (TPR) repeat protein